MHNESLVCYLKIRFLCERSELRLLYTLRRKATFYLEITKNLMFEICEFCEK